MESTHEFNGIGLQIEEVRFDKAEDGKQLERLELVSPNPGPCCRLNFCHSLLQLKPSPTFLQHTRFRGDLPSKMMPNEPPLISLPEVGRGVPVGAGRLD